MTRLCLLASFLVACGGAPAGGGNDNGDRARRPRPENDRSRCDTRGEDREVSEVDTSGDEFPDVRRVFRRVGELPMIRLILACREADLNDDGIKDVVRFYNEEGRALREEADRNFDGQIDIITYFQEGRVVRQEIDANANGRVDTKIYYERGRVVRTERDLLGRSTQAQWRADRWEYFENGRMVRMGTDLDGDGTVDRWDRDARWSEQQRRQEEAAEIEHTPEDE